MSAPLPPVTALPDDAPASASEGPTLVRAAPLLRRMAAFLYEGVLVFGIVFATALVFAVAMHQTHALQDRSGLIATCFLVLGLYFVGLWWRSGQTLAMKTWNLRVVTASGAALTPRLALMRYLAAWIWFLPPLVLANVVAPQNLGLSLALPAGWIVLYALATQLHPRRQFWHDALCGTAVIDAGRQAPLPR